MPSEKYTVKTSSPEGTKEEGRKFAKLLQRGDVVSLIGELGSGKTVFTKGIASFFSVEENEVISPSFTIINVYPTPFGFSIYHADLYRIDMEDREIILQILEASGEGNIVILEWADHSPSLVKNSHFIVKFENLSEKERKIYIEEGEGRWHLSFKSSAAHQ